MANQGKTKWRNCNLPFILCTRCVYGYLLACTQPKWPNQMVARIFGRQSTVPPLRFSLRQSLIRMAFTILTLKMVLATKSAFNETPLFIRFIWTILKTIANIFQIYTFTAIVTCYKMKIVRFVFFLFKF